MPHCSNRPLFCWKTVFLVSLLIGLFVSPATYAAKHNDQVVQEDTTLSILQMPITNQPTILLFYSRDCAPCQQEMAMLPALVKAAPHWQFSLLELSKPDKALAAKANSLHVTIYNRAVAGLALLKQLDDQQMALPFSVAVNAQNQICGQRIGLLGSDIIKDWEQSCL